MKKLVYAVIVVMVLAWAAGCVTVKPVKTSESAVREKLTSVSDEEYEQWKKSVKEGKDSAERSKGAFWCGQYNYNKKNYDEAIKYFSYNEKYYSDVDWGYLSILRLYDISIETGKKDEAIDKLKVLLEKRHEFSQFEDVAVKRLDELASKMGREELKALYAKHTHKLIDEYALYYLSLLDLKEGNYDEFYVHSNAFLIDFRDSKFYAEITAKYKESVKYKPVNNKKIGVVVPLTGKSMDIGADVKSGLELAVSEYNEGKTPELKISLIYMDEEDPKLEQTVIKSIETDGVIAIIGPLYSKTVKTLAPVLERYNTVLFSSTAAQPDLMGKSKYFFRNCATAKGQAYATANYIVSDTAYRKLASIYSDNAYGKTLNDFFAEKMKASGGEMVKQVSYDPKTNDFQEGMVQLGGINTILLKDKRGTEKQKLDDIMEASAKSMMQKIFDYLNVTPPDETVMPKPTPDPALQRISICVLHMSPSGDDVAKYEMDDDTTKKISYTMAKSSILSIIKQKACDDAMESMGIAAEDLDRELALSIASKLGAQIIIWGKITEARTDTKTANFLPETEVDSKGNTNVVYNFTDDDYFNYTIKLYAMAVTDEAVIDEVDLKYRKVKEPKKNPITIDALYIPATDRKMGLIKDQLKFYDFDLPVFASSSLNSPYIADNRESVEGVIYPMEFYPDDPDPVVQEFVKKYREKYTNSPDAISAGSYDAMKIIGSLLDREITSRENFRAVLSAVRGYQGVTGLFSFDPEGDSVKEYYMMQVDKDNIKFLKKVTGE
jgi:ABC-type branched-subunit amino acid transport system substrate-binding protein